MTDRLSLDDLEADLGRPAALKVLANCGGQRRHVPLPRNVNNSELARELGLEITSWLAERFGGLRVEFPTHRARRAEAAAARLRADVIEAGLTHPTRSANDIALAHDVSARRVEQLRQELRDETARYGAARRKVTRSVLDLPLFKRTQL